MHHFISAALAGTLLLLIPMAHSQPVPNIGADQLLASMPALPAKSEEAYRRAYPNGPQARVGAESFYQAWLSRVAAAGIEVQRQQAEFYRQYPTGIRPVAAPANRVSAGHQTAMNDAMAEFAARMQADPAFAQAFSKKSEAEQQAYIQQLMADKGLKPASGTPNMPVEEEEPVNWVDLTTTINTEWAAFLPANSVSALLFEAEQQHARISEKLNADLEKVPMVEMGEYGHDHDPKLVEEFQQKALEQHRTLAAGTLTEGREVLRNLTSRLLQLYAPYQQELQNAKYGQGHDFGMYYTHLLGEQLWLIQQVDQIGREAILLTDHVAYWEQQQFNP